MSSVSKKITIDLEETLTTIDNGYYKNLKPKYILSLGEQKTRFFFLNAFRKISKYRIKNSLEYGF